MTFYSTAITCLRSFILDYFGEKASNYCGNCSNCLSQFTEVDITVDAQKILSCIKRTGERFGKKMICDILRGSMNERIIKFRLAGQTTYGLMRERSVAQVREMIDYLEFEGYIETRGNEYPTLAVTQKANAVLLGEEQLVMKQAKPKAPAVLKLKKGKIKETVDRSLLAELKALRRKIADSKSVPAYVVFSDATLVDMCQKHPTTVEELLDVSGVGRVKLELYGEKFLQILRTYDRTEKES